MGKEKMKEIDCEFNDKDKVNSCQITVCDKKAVHVCSYCVCNANAWRMFLNGLAARPNRDYKTALNGSY